MDWQMILFSTSGRINRAKYWLAALIYIFISAVAVIAAIFLITSMAEASAVILYVGGSLLFLAIVFSGIAVGIKRLHDRDKSGWWVIPFMILPGLLNGASGLVNPGMSFGLAIASGVLGIWGLIELGFLRGTAGPNQFGPDPLVEVPATS